MSKKQELDKQEDLEFREVISNILKFLCFLIIYGFKGEKVLLYIGCAYLLYAVIRIIVLCGISCKKIDLYLYEIRNK